MARTIDNALSFKFILVGDSGVGKTAIIKRFCENWFSETIPQTIGLDFATRTVELSGSSVILQMWDPAGQEKFRSITRSYFRSSSAVFVVFDVTNRMSFCNIQGWMDDSTRLSPANAVHVVVGNKSDLVTTRVVGPEEAKAFADEHSLQYFETSALSGDRVEDLFLNIAQLLHDKVTEGKINAGTYYAGLETQPVTVRRHHEHQVDLAAGCC
jgi:small GTP-binding protein